MSRRRIYEPRIVTDHIMMQDDFDRLHEYLLERESIPEASDVSAKSLKMSGLS